MSRRQADCRPDRPLQHPRIPPAPGRGRL